VAGPAPPAMPAKGNLGKALLQSRPLLRRIPGLVKDNLNTADLRTVTEEMTMTMTNELAGRICTPCRGGVPPMILHEAKQYLEQAPGWALLSEGTRLERTFTFTDFKDALDLVDRIGALAEREGHHPDIRFGWGYCTVELYTHKINGLHENDFIMAAKINALAEA
jgi:4a-hydroxytetrahydrobiopterin dehydratase